MDKPETSDGLDEASLLAAIVQRRDGEAFRALCERYQDMAFNLAYRMTHHRPLAEDAVQESMLALWLSRKIPTGNVRGWILSMVVHKSLNLLQQRKRSLIREGRSGTMNALNAEANLPGAAIEHAELLAALRIHLDRLPELERQMLTLRFGAEESEAGIGKLLSIPRQTIAFKLQAALNLLRSELANAGFAVSLPLLNSEVIGKAILSGHAAPPGLQEKITHRIAQVELEAGSRLSRRSAAPVPFRLGAWTIACALILAAGAAAWRQAGAPASPAPASTPAPSPTQEAADSHNAEHPSTERTAEALAAPARPFERRWVFETPELPKDFKVLQGSWHFVPGGGPEGKGCMETESDYFKALLDCTIARDVLYLRCEASVSVWPEYSQAARSQNPMAIDMLWEKGRQIATLHNLHKPKTVFSKDAKDWIKVEIFLSPRHCAKYYYGELSWMSLIEPIGEAKLVFHCNGRHSISAIAIRQIQASQWPDISGYLAEVEKIPAHERQGILALPGIQNGIPGKPAFVRFPGQPEYQDLTIRPVNFLEGKQP